MKRSRSRSPSEVAIPVVVEGEHHARLGQRKHRHVEGAVQEGPAAVVLEEAGQAVAAAEEHEVLVAVEIEVGEGHPEPGVPEERRVLLHRVLDAPLEPLGGERHDLFAGERVAGEREAADQDRG